MLRGETSHYDVVVSETARGVQLAQLDTGVPLIFCVLTCDTLEQAINRAGLKSGNKGYEAGLGAVEMGQLMKKIAKTAAPAAAAAMAKPAAARDRTRGEAGGSEARHRTPRAAPLDDITPEVWSGVRDSDAV